MSYFNTLITLAPDCPVTHSELPENKHPQQPLHLMQHEMLTEAPYTLDHYSLIFETYLRKNGLDPDMTGDERKALWDQLFSKGHPCLRASALTKRYGFGAHYNAEGKIALYPVESEEYKALLADDNVKKVPAMRSKR